MQGEAPYSHTFQSAATSGLGSLMDSAGLGDLKALLPWLLNLVKGYTPSLPWNSLLGTNMTGYGVMMSMQRQALSSAASSMAPSLTRYSLLRTGLAKHRAERLSPSSTPESRMAR